VGTGWREKVNTCEATAHGAAVFTGLKPFGTVVLVETE